MSAPTGLPPVTRVRRGRKWEQCPGKIGAWLAESDFGTAPAVARALHDAVDDAFLTYLPEATAREVEAACAAFYASRHGWAVDPGRVHLVPDVLAGLRLVIDAFTPPGSAVVVPTPAYMPFLTVPVAMGRPVVQVPSIRTGERWHMDLEGVDRAFADGARLLVLCNPHNPLGQVMTREEMADVAAVVERHGARVFSDEIHAPLVYPAGARHLPYASHSEVAAAHTVTATATSKGWNVPGLKSAQLILSSAADEAWWRATDPVPTQGGSILGAVAATAAYTEGVAWLDAMLVRLDRSRVLLSDLLAEHLPEVAWVPPAATYLAWLDLSPYPVGEPIGPYLAEHAGVVTTDGRLCGARGDDYVRFTFAMQDEVLQEAVRRIARAVRR